MPKFSVVSSTELFLSPSPLLLDRFADGRFLDQVDQRTTLDKVLRSLGRRCSRRAKGDRANDNGCEEVPQDFPELQQKEL